MGLVRPDSEVGVAAVDSPVFSIALAAVTLDPATGASLSTFSLTEGVSAFGAGAVPPRLRTFAPPDFSTLGASPPIERTLAFGAADVPFEVATGLSVGAAGTVVDVLCVLESFSDGRLAIFG